MKGTFNQGWWNCFESFAAEILSVDKYATDVCLRVLDQAGITRREAEAWLDKPTEHNPRVEQTVRDYLAKCK